MSDLPTVLFIGVGHMGGPMAHNLLRGRVSLAVSDVSEEALAPFRERGLPVATRSAELPGEVVITILPTDVQVREAVLGEGGALTGSVKRRTLIDMTSAAPTPTKQLATELAQRGIEMIDAPVSGGVPRAKTGELTAMVGGDAAVVERYRPLLAHMCKNVRHVGTVGAGDTVKSLNNFLSAVALWASSEALLIGARAGLDPATLVDVWKTSTATSHAVQHKIPAAVLPRTFDYGFQMGLMAKDLGIAARLARELDVPAPILASTEEHYLLAREAMGERVDFTEVLLLLERWAKFEVPKVAS
ncbi:MAG: NAD(P)-dependent oxidoreductase [bacterium]|nr:NAD(P)-dependent oxidoreductase [bacterium]